MTASDVYWKIRSSNAYQLGRTPKVGEITTMLDFLASPVIGCVTKTEDGYFANASLSDAEHKFTFYAKSFK